MTQKQYHQANMFAAADLPLFSGTAQHASANTFQPAEPLLPEIQDVMPFVAPAQPAVTTLAGPTVTTDDIRHAFIWSQKGFSRSYMFMEVRKNYLDFRNGKHSYWDTAYAAGKSYMVGRHTSDAEYNRTHYSNLTPWQKVAYQWARQNPTQRLCIDMGKNQWEVYDCREYVTFALPHQDHGGERHYITRDGKRKLLVNVD